MYPVLVRRLIPRIGFGWAVRVIAFIAMIDTAVALLLLRPIPKSPHRRKIITLNALTELPFLFFSISLFLGFMAFWIPFVYLPSFGIFSLHMEEDSAFYMLCVLNAGSFLGRILPALVAQKAGPMQVFVGATVICSVLLFGWIGVVNVSGFYAFAALFGFFSGVLVSVPPATVAHPVLSPSMSVVGTRLGMSWSFTGLGVLVGSPIAGALIKELPDGSMDFLDAQIFAGACMVVAAAVLVVPLVAIWRYDRQKPSETTRVASVQDDVELDGRNNTTGDTQPVVTTADPTLDMEFRRKNESTSVMQETESETEVGGSRTATMENEGVLK